MGRALLASDVAAGPKDPAGSLIFREPFSSVTTSGLLARCWATDFENSPPARRVAAYKGQRNLSGLWWCASTNRHAGFESWLERDHQIRLDLDSTVTGIASQPFRIKFPEPFPQIWHVPDYFVRRADGTGLVIDVRPDARVNPIDQTR